MAFVREQKPGGMARAKQVSEGLGNLASGAMKLQVLGQQQQRLDMEKAEQPLRMEEMQARAVEMRERASLMQQQAEMQRNELRKQSDQQFTKMAFQAALMYGDDNNALKNFYSNYADDLGKAAVMRGTPMSGEELENFFVNKTKIFSKDIPDLQNGMDAVQKAMSSGKPDAQTFQKGMALFDKAFYRVATAAPELQEGVLSDWRKSMVQQFKEAQATGLKERELGIDAAKVDALERAAGGKLPKAVEYDQKKFLEDFQKQSAAYQKRQTRLARYNELEKILNASTDAKTGAFLGGEFMQRVFSASSQAKGKTDQDRVRNFLAQDIGDQVAQTVAESGAKSSDSDRELQNIINRSLNTELNAESIKSIIEDFRKVIEYSDMVYQARAKYAQDIYAGQARGPFIPPAMGAFNNVENAPITGQQGATPPAAPKAAGPSAAMRQFLIQDE